jgi:hypothetical protein
MKNAREISMALLLLCGACGTADGTGGGDAGASQALRDVRYCEILLGFLEDGSVKMDIYNTTGLNDCPSATWDAIDPAQVQAQFQAVRVVMNGPRQWVIDAFTDSAFLDPTPVTLGGLAMREAGEIDLPLAEATSTGSPYVARSVHRDTTYVFDAGKRVYELLDPAGRAFDMQSFSLQHAALTEADLPDLGARLSLPAGWTYRARTLSAELHVTAVGGLATIVQDDLANTYQLSPQ